MKIITKEIYVFFVLIISSLVVNAQQLELPKIFSDNMVLQREMSIPVWGWAQSGKEVTVTFNKKQYNTTANDQGEWELKMDAAPVGGPYSLTVKSEGVVLTKENILVGDVWICGGQSNMQFGVNGTLEKDMVLEDADELTNIRFARVAIDIQNEKVDDVKNTGWAICNKQRAAGFSAVAYNFGKKINSDNNIPLGLISTNWGGTTVESWISPEPLIEQGDFKPLIEAMYSVPLDSLKKAPRAKDYPSVLYYAMLEPLIPYGIKGVIWYQGESNIDRADQYRELFPTLIKDWREQWGQGDFPFLWVQLPNYLDPCDDPGDSRWAELRDAQSLGLRLPNTGEAVTIDLGSSYNIHPRLKKPVGERLALIANKMVYGKDSGCYGPNFKSMEIRGNKVIISFSEIAEGLIVKNKYGNTFVNGFAIAGSNEKFYWATKSKIKGDKVIISSSKVDKPVAVRYGWCDNPIDLNLVNTLGLPAKPFRTDDWDLSTKGNKYPPKSYLDEHYKLIK